MFGKEWVEKVSKMDCVDVSFVVEDKDYEFFSMVWWMFFDMDFVVPWVEESRIEEMGRYNDLSRWKDDSDDGC